MKSFGSFCMLKYCSYYLSYEPVKSLTGKIPLALRNYCSTFHICYRSLGLGKSISHSKTQHCIFHLLLRQHQQSYHIWGGSARPQNLVIIVNNTIVTNTSKRSTTRNIFWSNSASFCSSCLDGITLDFFSTPPSEFSAVVFFSSDSAFISFPGAISWV